MDGEWGRKTKKPEGDLCSEVPSNFKICCPPGINGINGLQLMQGLSACSCPLARGWSLNRERISTFFLVVSLCGMK